MTRSDLTDRIMSVSAIVAAIAAVAVSAYEARINREYQRISVWPRVQQANTFVPGDPYQRVVSNVGVGPALIRSVQISVDGVTRRTWGEVSKALIGKPLPGHIYSSLHAGAVVLPNKDITVLKIAPSPEAESFWEQTQTPRLSIRICYSSLFGECWLSDSLAEQPAPVAECRSDPAKEFQQ
ncbi:MAG: hypothetical protein V7609_1752 [Verrucomicrobiota bacterium]